ncbi:hypothetical protein EXIGLDRAFT_834143 [Exidia glandulosa HHB12029]|uniref:MYND-type domain-containing protein n=1 Tax=Exidia glandulosa HHB12029 TaxID=1314781 RepID=A0A165K4F4_EXIGL|nr:hypothetical protein EXIGLDRAFT_834143 [Exidia glandulosa HHB12029]
MVSDLVKKFNALPRKPMAPSGLVSNEWHFDVRYIPLDPPSHVLFIVQPGSRYVHQERLPLDVPMDQSGLTWFPETPEEAAAEVARALVHSFVDNMGLGKFERHPPPPTAPWSWMTMEPALAAAVGKELSRMGVAASLLQNVKVSSEDVQAIANESFTPVFRSICPHPAVPVPEAINFGVVSIEEKVPHYEDATAFALAYYQLRQNNTPPQSNIDDTPAFDPTVVQQTYDILRSAPTTEVKARADAGNPGAALDYGLRQLLGYEGNYNAKTARLYLMKVVMSQGAPPRLKATAHALLIGWYTQRTANYIPSRYLFAATWHAEEALREAEPVCPPDYAASPGVLLFLMTSYKRFTESLEIPALVYLYKRCYRALEKRDEQVLARHALGTVKRLKRPNRYQCATAGCGIVVESGKALQRCGGKCDEDKKPFYCGRECQAKDWKNHKPFCKPGMPCSIIDTATPPPTLGGAPGSNSIGIRVGDTLISSSTLSAAELRRFRDAAQDRPSGRRPVNLMHMERHKLDPNASDSEDDE